MSASGRARLLIAGCVLLGLAGPVAAAEASAPGTPAEIADPPSLLPVPPADLSGLEPQVRAQLEAARANFAASAARADLTRTERAEAYGELGGTYHVHHMYVPAETCYRNAAELAPGDFRWPYYLGHLYQATSQPALGLASFQRALQLRPDDPHAQLRLAQVYLEDFNQPERAIPLLDKPAQVPELRATALYGLGKAALMQKDYVQAIARFEEALSIYPGAHRIRYPLALAYRGLGNTAKAREQLAKRGDGEPEAPDPLMDELKELVSGARPHLYRAINAVRARHFDDAVEAFAKALAVQPENVNARVSFARSLYLTGDRAGARRELNAALARDRNHAATHFFLGLLLEEDGDSAGAMAQYRQTLAVDPDHGGAHFYLAGTLMRRGQYESAAAHYRQATVLVPDNLPAWIVGAVALVRAGRPDAEARALLEDAIVAHPDTPVFEYALARLLAASAEASVRDGERAVRMAEALYQGMSLPENAETLAMGYAELARYEDAVSMQDEAVGLAMMMGRFDLIGRLSDTLKLYQQGKPSRSPWPQDDPVFQPRPVDASGPFRDYPAGSAF